MYVKIFQIPVWVGITQHLIVGLQNILDVNIDEVIERINVLFHQTLYLQKLWQEKPFVLKENKKVRNIIS